MKLPNIPFFQKKEKPQYILSLVLRNEKVNSFIFEKVSGQISVISEDEEYFENSIETATLEELLDVCDRVISQAEESLPQNLEVQKTIFGLKETWVLDNKIKKEYLLKLKKISSDLGLSPIGFLTIPEAIVNFIQKEEGAPPSAILADIGKKYVTVSLVRAGKIMESKTSEIHESPSFTVDTLLKHFETPEILPSRVIILNGEEDLAQEFITHQWSKSLPFLHLPQTINLPENFLGRAFIYGVANRMGAIVKEDFEDKEALEIEQIEKPQVEETSKVEYLGSAAEYFGFLEEEDVAKTPLLKPQDEAIPEEIIKEEIEELPQELKEKETKGDLLPSVLSVTLPKIKKILNNFTLYLKKLTLPSFLNFGNKKIILFPIILLAILFFLLAFYILFLKADVVLTFTPKIVEKNQTITFSTSRPSDFKANIINAELLSVSEDGTNSKSATGKKEIGERAKGTVTVFNNSSALVTLPSQTAITYSNKLDFLTDNKVTIASASGDIFSGTKPGTANVSVTGSTFGTEYNLPSGTKFSIGTNSSIAAKNDNPFSGGTKKEITVISKVDIEKLLEDLPKQLEEKAREDIRKKVSSGKETLNKFITTSIDKKSFDKNPGDEAKSVTLSGTVSFQTLSYNKNDLLKFSLNLFDATDAAINKENLEVSVLDIKTKEDDIETKLKIKAKILPKIDSENLRKKIAGLSFKDAEDELFKLNQISDVRISFSGNFKFLPKILPKIPGHIKIVIK